MSVAQLVEQTSLTVKDQNAGIKVKPIVRVHPDILIESKVDGIYRCLLSSWSGKPDGCREPCSLPFMDSKA